MQIAKFENRLTSKGPGRDVTRHPARQKFLERRQPVARLFASFRFFSFSAFQLFPTVPSLHPALAPIPTEAPSALRPRWSLLLLFACFGWLWFFLCRQLSYEWAANEQYNYGWFVPFFAVFLFWLRWEEGRKVGRKNDEVRNAATKARSEFRASPTNFFLLAFAFLLLAALLPVRLFEVANPDWRPLSWIHAFIVVSLTLGAIWYWGGKAALRHFAFPVCFILVAVPWITPIESPLVQGLMRVVASIATEALTLFGIPAQLDGSLIRVNSGVVGVSEACSGVRSLQTSLMIGLLFGELKRLTIARRFLLVGAALAVAFVANCARAFFLVWIAATQNLQAVTRWHDVAGYSIVVAVFLGTVAIAAALAKGESEKEELINAEASPRFAVRVPPFLPSSFLILTFCCLLLIEAGVSGWYRWHERNFVATSRWTVRWPETIRGFHNLAIDDNVKSTLRYDSGREAEWPISLTSKPNEPRAAGSCSMFFFRWQPGSASILRARAHRPDICLPNTGWRMVADDGVRSYIVSPGFSLPFRHFRFVHDAAAGNGRSSPRRFFASAKTGFQPPGLTGSMPPPAKLATGCATTELESLGKACATRASRSSSSS
jgi:exosortase